MREIEKKLCEYREIQRGIAEIEIKIRELESKKERIYDMMLSPKPLERDRVTGGAQLDQIAEAVVQLVDVYAERIKKLSGDLASLYARLNHIEDIINRAQLSAVERKYIVLRYFDGMPSWKVAQKLGYTERWACEYRRSALKKIKKIWGA